ncbi:MAG: tetratricopeptide repeat protein [Cytophagaceae bacterium]|nr:tetratricopeptide repeat protein [Cytophagaceae bacterium]
MRTIQKTGLALLSALCLSGLGSAEVLAQSALAKQAAHQFDQFAYRDAIDLYEQALAGKGLSDTERQAAKLRLAYAYRQVRDTQKAERLYRELVGSGPTFVSDDGKTYLYYAQALASNGKYRESQEAYERYTKSQSEDTRGKGFSKLYTDVSKLARNAGSYKVEYLNVNTNKADFSPMYYKGGIVFCSGRSEGQGIKRVFNWDKSAFLDLYYLTDLSALSGSSASGLGGSAKAVKQRRGKRSNKPLGRDEYTAPTANDTRTVGSYGGNQVSAGLGYAEVPESESDRFSKTLNTKYHEGPATFTQDAARVIFTRNNYNNGDYKESADKINKLKIYTAEEKNGLWSNVQEVPFNGDEFSTGHPTLTRDDKLMYFVSDRPGGQGGTDLYVVEYNQGAWGTPRSLGAKVNTKGNEMFPFVDERGNLYFSSDGHPGMGDLDLFFVEMVNGEPTGKVMNLGAPINSNKDDFGLITDGERRQGYFSSNRKRGGIDDDIYRFNRDGSLYACRELTLVVVDAETRQPIGQTTVAVERQGGPAEDKAAADGKIDVCLEENNEYLFKASHEGYLPNTVGFSTKGESDDAPSRLEIPLAKPVVEKPIESVVANKISTLRGRVTTQKDKQPIEGVVVILRNECDGTTQQAVTGVDGSYQFDVVANCDYTLEALKDDYGTLGSKIAKIDPDKATDVVPADLTLFKKGDLVQVENIYYDLSKWNIRTDAASELDKLVDVMKKYPNLRIELRSHTDTRATAKFNKTLSTKRAKAAVAYLKKNGIKATRVVAAGYGESVPVNPCKDGVPCTEEQHQQNRRTEFKVLQLK